MPLRRRRIRRFRGRSRRRTSRVGRNLLFARGHVPRNRTKMRFFRNLNSLAEKKVLLFDINGLSIQQSPLQYSPIVSISNGTGAGQRIGTKVFVRYMWIKGFISENASATSMVRMCALWARQNNVPGGGQPSTYQGPWDQTEYTVLHDRLIALGGSSTNGAAALATRPIYMKIRVMKTFIFDQQTNAVNTPVPFFWFWSNDLINPSPQLYATIYTTFTDV